MLQKVASDLLASCIANGLFPPDTSATVVLNTQWMFTIHPQSGKATPQVICFTEEKIVSLGSVKKDVQELLPLVLWETVFAYLGQVETYGFVYYGKNYWFPFDSPFYKKLVERAKVLDRRFIARCDSEFILGPLRKRESNRRFQEALALRGEIEILQKELPERKWECHLYELILEGTFHRSDKVGFRDVLLRTTPHGFSPLNTLLILGLPQ